MEKLTRTIKELADQLKNVDINKIVAVKVNSVIKDVNTFVSDNDVVEYIMEGDETALEILRHSAAHLMAHAVKHLYKDAKLAIGPAIENGFYYDIDLDIQLSDSDLLAIEKEMKKYLIIIMTLLERKCIKMKQLGYLKNLTSHTRWKF